MDAIELLVSQHHTLEALLKTVLAWPEPKVCRERLLKVADALALHMIAEETVFYPVLGKDLKAIDEQARALEEHQEMRALLDSLMNVPPLSPAFADGLALLQHAMQRHHLDEETRVFPRLRQLINMPRRNELGTRLEQMQLQILRQGMSSDSTLMHVG